MFIFTQPLKLSSHKPFVYEPSIQWNCPTLSPENGWLGSNVGNEYWAERLQTANSAQEQCCATAGKSFNKGDCTQKGNACLNLSYCLQLKWMGDRANTWSTYKFNVTALLGTGFICSCWAQDTTWLLIEHQIWEQMVKRCKDHSEVFLLQCKM